MRQSERASIMRIVSDLIEADGIIDAREIIFLDSLREKYGIKKEDEVAAASYTFAAALNELLLADDSLKHDLIGDFNQTAMSDNYCAREEALLISIFGFCLIETFDTASQPTLGQPQGFFGIVIIRISWTAFIKSHHDVGSNRPLNIHHLFRSEKMFGTINMRTEFCSLFMQLAVV